MNADFFWFIPLCTVAAGVLIAAIKHRPANTAADTAARSKEWKRLIDWNQRLQDECEACHRERDEWRARAITAEAASEGIGMVRTAQAIADAERRQSERDE